MSYESDINRVIKSARDQGWRHSMTERGHHQFLSPDNKTIVHAAGTPSDQRGWQNFMGDMKRGGYQTHPGGATIGDIAGQLLQRVNGTADVKPPGANMSARDVIREHLRKNPPGCTVQDLSAAFKALKPDAHPSGVSQALVGMVGRGEVVRVRQGFYRTATDEDRNRIAIGLPPKEPVTAAPPPSNLVVAPLPVVGQVAAAASTGDDQIDSELAELDAAVTQVLDGFTTLERLLRRHRETMRALAQVKKMLTAMGSIK